MPDYGFRYRCELAGGADVGEKVKFPTVRSSIHDFLKKYFRTRKLGVANLRTNINLA